MPGDVLDPATMQALVDLSNQSGGKLLDAMIDAFLTEECPTALTQLRQAASTADMPAFAQAAHKLRGSLTTFGATNLAALCTDLEAQAKANTLSDPGGHLHSLEADLAAVAEALSSYKTVS